MRKVCVTSYDYKLLYLFNDIKDAFCTCKYKKAVNLSTKYLINYEDNNDVRYMRAVSYRYLEILTGSIDKDNSKSCDEDE